MYYVCRHVSCLVSTLSPRCRPLGQSVTQRCAHSSRLDEEDSSAQYQTNPLPCVSTKCVQKLYILHKCALDVSFTIPGECCVEFAELPNLSKNLLGVFNFYFTHRDADCETSPLLDSTESVFPKMKTKALSLWKTSSCKILCPQSPLLWIIFS